MKDTPLIMATIYLVGGMSLLVEGGSTEGIALGVCLGLVALVWMFTGDRGVRR